MKNYVKEGQKLPLYGVGPMIVFGMGAVTAIGIILFAYVWKIGVLETPWVLLCRIAGVLLIVLGLTVWFIGALRSDMDATTVWTVGSKSSYRLRLFGFIPFGTHTIRIVRFDPDGVSSREGNRYVPVWNHDILLVPIDENHTEYTDRVEIRAGWKTIFIWLWAKAFYAHRQRRWIRLLKEGEAQ